MSKNEEIIGVLVCAPADRVDPPFADSLYGHCRCGQEIMFRPRNDRADLLKLCYVCAIREADAAKEQGEPIEVAALSDEQFGELEGKGFGRHEIERVLRETATSLGGKVV